MKLRVIQQSGRTLGLFESMGRNLIRFIDMLPVFYFIGALCVFVTRRQQRLGDMVAGTLVVHSKPVDTPFSPSGSRTFTAPSFEPLVEEVPQKLSGLQADAVRRLDQEDLHMIDNFLDRRLDLPMEVRPNLAQKLARRMAAKTGQEVPAGMSDETFLEALAIGLREHPTIR
jgi:RDD family